MIIKNTRGKAMIFLIGFAVLLGKTSISLAQDTARVNQPYLFFPYPMQQNKWHVSIGYTMTALPQDVVEEVQVRAPLIDLHALRKLSKSLYIDGRFQTQIVQSRAVLGLRWAYILNDRVSISIGDDFAWWHGKLEIASFDTKANGWQNYPNASLGLRFREKVLLTFRGEALMNLGYTTTIAKDITEKQGFQFSGWAGSIILEQPFTKKIDMTLGFRGQYTDFFWQTWSLFETFDRRIFYPELIVGFIL